MMTKEDYKAESEQLRYLLKKALAKLELRDKLVNKIQVEYHDDKVIQSLIWEMEYDDDNIV